MTPVHTTSIGLLLLAVAGCSSLPGPGEPPDTAALAAASYEDRCAAAFRLADYVTARAGVRDAEAARVPGFPYLRSNRFLASFRNESMDDEELAAWLAEMWALDLDARRVEVANLPDGERGRLDDGLADLALGNGEAADTVGTLRQCGLALLNGPIADEELAASVRARAAVADHYSTAQRVFGLYAVTGAGVAAGFDAWKRENLNTFDRLPEEIPVQGELVRYGPESPAPASAAGAGADLLAAASISPLSTLSLQPSDLDRLAALYAPVFEIDVAGSFDRPGRPMLIDGPGRPVPSVDKGDAVVFFRLEHTRFQGAVLPQLIYTVWFSERPPRSQSDILSGRLDGVVWRVTLGLDGEPVVYDSIHPCGCYHLFFPVPPTERIPMPEDDDVREEALTPAIAPVLGTGQRIVVRLASGSHYIQRVYADDPGGSQRYAVAIPEIPDGPLRMVPMDGNGSTRSLYGETGLIAGTERDERFLLWPMGIESAGAMRQWGTHATAFLGRRHFDDPDLLDQAFRR